VSLLELAERCEQMADADGMSAEMRTLNADVLRALGWRHAEGDVIDPAGNLAYQIPYYVGSLDAALTLVPQGMSDWMVGNFHDSGMCADIFFPMAGNPSVIDQATAKAATPALALTAASLRARAAISLAGEGAK